MLRVDDLHASHGSAEVLHGIDLDVEVGAAVGVIGSNGAGKSTLLRTICGLHPAGRGNVELDGRSVLGWPAHRTARAGVGFVPAKRHLFPAMSVADNLAMGAYPAKTDASRLERVTALFPRLGERRRQPAGTLSGGEQQMLAIGRALMGAPRLLVLDEPSTGLAPGVAEEVYAVLAGLRDRDGLTLLIAEQQVPLVLGLVDRVSVMERGRVQLCGTAADVADDPDVQRVYLGVA